jgi:NTF2-like protein (DUF6841)
VAEALTAAIWSVIVDNSDASRWFAEYLDVFAACGRGERDTASLLAYYGVPLLLTTDDGFFALARDDQVIAAVQQQVDGMRAAAYDRSEVIDSEVTVLNSTSALGPAREVLRQRHGRRPPVPEVRERDHRRRQDLIPAGRQLGPTPPVSSLPAPVSRWSSSYFPRRTKSSGCSASTRQPTPGRQRPSRRQRCPSELMRFWPADVAGSRARGTGCRPATNGC